MHSQRMPIFPTDGAALDRLAWGLATLLALGAALLIVCAPAPWLHDFAEWLFQARVLALKLTEPELVSRYSLATYPVPNALATLTLAGLTLALPPLAAGKCYLLLQIAAWSWLLRRLVRERISPESRGSVFLVLVAVVAFSSFFWYGFISYQLGLWLLLWFLLACGPGAPAWKIALFGIALFLSHAMVALVWGLVVAGRALRLALDPPAGEVARRAMRFLRDSLPILPVALLALWYLAARLALPRPVAAPDAQMSGWLEAAVYKAGYPLMLGGFRNILGADGRGAFEDWPWVYLLGAFANAVLVVLIALWGARVLWLTRPRGGAWPTGVDRDPALLWALYGLIILYLVAPYDFMGLLNPAGRLLIPMVLLLIAVAPPQTLVWWRWASLPAGLGLALAVAGYAAVLYGEPRPQLRQRVDFHRGEPASGNHSVFGFNRSLYASTRYPYFNYRVLVNGQRLGQVVDGDYRGLGFRTGLIVAEQATQSRP